MTALYILSGVLLLLLLLLFLPVHLSLIYSDKLSIKLAYLFFNFSLYPKEKKVRLSDYTPRKIRKKKRKIRKKRQLEKATLKVKKKPQKTLKQKLRQVRLILHILKNTYAGILSAVRVRVHRLYITVATDDAAKTALLYGVAAQSTAYLMEVLGDFTKTTAKRGAVDVVADFCGSESTLDAAIVFSVTPFSILVLGIRAAFLFLKYKLKKQPEKIKNGVN